MNAIPFGTTIIAPIPSTIPSAAGLVEATKQTPVDFAFIVPSIVEELAQNAALLDHCSRNLEAILYSGGDLPQAIGDVVASKIKIFNRYGASELGLMPVVLDRANRDRADWGYIEFHPDLGVELEPVSPDAAEHEFCIVYHPDRGRHQPTFSIWSFLGWDRYESRDLYVRHPAPNKRNLWRWHARKDDIIVFLNGEKTNPVSMEQHVVSRNAGVMGALVVGAQRFQAALLVETVPTADDTISWSPSDRAALLEQVWPSIAEANRECPAHARISKSHVLFVHPNKPMLRAGKGTVQRAATITLYKDELDALYRDAEQGTSIPPLDSEIALGPGFVADQDAIKNFVSQTIKSVTDWTDLSDAENIFARGMDSLQSITAIRILRHGLDMKTISVPLIYSHPSVSGLAEAIMKLREDELSNVKASTGEKLSERQRMLDIFRAELDRIPESLPPASSSTRASKTENSRSVILTGSTGAMGSYVLDDLVGDPAVERVYCLNRRADGRAAQIESNTLRHLDTNLDEPRVTFLKADLSKNHFGLAPEVYGQLLNSVTTVIHAAWPVNFNMPLSSFEPQLAGIVNLVSFCASAAAVQNRPAKRLFFVSSISSTMHNYYGSHDDFTADETVTETLGTAIPEKIVLTSSPAANGYGESKYLAEQLLDHAAQMIQRIPGQRPAVEFATARVGQVAGPVKRPGLWNPAEWFPSLVLSSLHIGAIPDSLGPVMGNIDWVPVDLLSRVLVELALSPSRTAEGGVDVFHPHNLHRKPYASILPGLLEELSRANGNTNGNLHVPSVEVIPFERWVFRVRQDLQNRSKLGVLDTDGDLEALLKANPAVKLLEFYETNLSQDMKARKSGIRDSDGTDNDIPSAFETSYTAGSNSTLRAVPGVSQDWIAKWVEEWMPIAA